MIIYNVTINVDDEIHDDWISWMKKTHIPDVMKTGYFEEYKLCKILTRQEGETGFTYSIQYMCESIFNLETYQDKHAVQLQKEHNSRYHGKFVAFRTLLEVV